MPVRLLPVERWLIALIVIFAVTFPLGALACGSLNTAPDSSPLRLLVAKRYDDLDKQMNALQVAYEQGKIDELALLDGFRAFYIADPDLEPNYREWLAKYPASYAAHLAHGIYYKYLAREARGCAFVSDTGVMQMDVMEFYFRKAIPELEQSTTLAEIPVITDLHLLDIAMFQGDRERLNKALSESVRVSPKNFIVRRQYMLALTSRWLGSPKAMQAFLQTCKEAGLSESQTGALEAMVLADDAWVKIRQNRKPEALVEYSQALALARDNMKFMTPSLYQQMLDESSYYSSH
ncbi:DUF4034 domain-containing protein [Dyella amyloliquefaciens]|uniref:DUF4034 domain-containing protein n=1 Tax=Dyella amyloliquefaciens TaxID=1770545 RepID=UPI00102E3933|nr:DUF4034 domain-containing protein [Dyella amyloliquefaciens]